MPSSTLYLPSKIKVLRPSVESTAQTVEFLQRIEGPLSGCGQKLDKIKLRFASVYRHRMRMNKNGDFSVNSFFTTQATDRGWICVNATRKHCLGLIADLLFQAALQPMHLGHDI